MSLTRALALSATLIVTAVALAQDAPEAFRYRAEAGTITEYGGKTDSGMFYVMSFATGLNGERVPADVLARLKPAFERDYARSQSLPLVGSAGSSVTVFNSTETVENVLEDGTRVVGVESYAQTTGLFGLGQTTETAYTRIHAPDGNVTSGEASVKIETAQPYSANKDTNARIIASLEQGQQYSLVVEAVTLSICYQATPGAAVPLMFDPTQFALPDGTAPDQTAVMRVGDVRSERLPDGTHLCHSNLEPLKYMPTFSAAKFVSRGTRRFSSDGRLERSEYVSSTTINALNVALFEFEGKTYRVRFVNVFRNQGSLDRL